MTEIPLLFDPKESLEILKYHNPEFWEVDIISQKIDILQQVNPFKISHSKALGNCIRDCKTMAERILVMAAYQNIMDQKAVHYQNTCDKIARVEFQIKHLTDSVTISEADMMIIGEFYYDELLRLLVIRKDCLATPELCRHLQVQYDSAFAPKTQKS